MRLAVGLRAQRDRGVERLGGERPERGPLGLRHLPDRAQPASDVAGVVRAVGVLDQRVELGQAVHVRDRHEAAAAEAPDLALHAALLVRALDAGLAEEAVEAVVRAQRREAVALDAVAAAQHAHHRRAQIVVADAARHAAEAAEGDRVALEERLLALAREADVHRPSRVREPHEEHRQLGQHAVQPDADRAEVGLRLLARGMQLGDGHLRAAGLELAPHARDVGAHRRLGDARAALVHQPLPDAPRGVALLARRAQVGDQPLPDRRLVGTELRRRSARRLARRRQRRPERLTHGAPVHAVAPRQLADGHALLAPVTSDMLEQLHLRQLLFLRSGRSHSPERSHWIGRRWGHFRGSKPLQVGPIQSSVPLGGLARHGVGAPLPHGKALSHMHLRGADGAFLPTFFSLLPSLLPLSAPNSRFCPGRCKTGLPMT